MFKIFFVSTIFSAVLLWYLHEYHTEKFNSFTQNIPYVAPIFTQFQLFLASFAEKSDNSQKLYSASELSNYDGKKGSKGVYISILGQIFDVQKGKRHYGPGGAYQVFAGRDASRSFISGDFTNVITDDVIDLTLKELLSLRDWLKFFQKEYIFKGKLVGRYYDNSGEKTEYSKELDLKFNEAEKQQKSKEVDEIHFPSCNVEWTQETGSRVWCTNKSGGIEREWVGVPRKLYKVGSDTFRCACIDLKQIKDVDSVQHARRGHIKQYEGCDFFATSCYVKS